MLLRLRLVLVFLIAIGLSVSLAAGCGGNQLGGGGGQGSAKKEGGSGGEGASKGAQLVKGVIVRADLDTRRFVLKPRDKDRILFRFNPENARVTFDREETGPEAIQKGRRASVRYMEKNDRQVARSVKVLPVQPGEESERTQQ